jgi:hypothetical protein
MSNSKILNSGYNELYNEIYCNLFPNDNGYKKCSNCNFGQQTVWKTIDATGERDCQNKCTADPRCTSYSFNTQSSTNNCTEYISFPQQLVRNIPNTNSGYSLTKFGFDYNRLTPQQKENIQNKCANQYINDTFTPNNPSINLTDCLTINNSNNSTQFDMDAECVFDVYKENNLPIKIKNNSVYNSKLGNGQNITNQSDPNIDRKYSLYNQYYTSKNNNFNLVNQLMGTEGINFSNNNQNVYSNNNKLNNNFPNTLGQNTMLNKTNSDILSTIINKEGFENTMNLSNRNEYKELFSGKTVEENMDNKKNFMFIILIIFLILFIFYVYKKK